MLLDHSGAGAEFSLYTLELLILWNICSCVLLLQKSNMSKNETANNGRHQRMLARTALSNMTPAIIYAIQQSKAAQLDFLAAISSGI